MFLFVFLSVCTIFETTSLRYSRSEEQIKKNEFFFVLLSLNRIFVAKKKEIEYE